MNNTTPSAICDSIETLIAGLTPSGGTDVGGKDAFAKIDEVDYNEDPEELATSELDRQFMIHGVVPDSIVTPGQTAHNTSLATVEIAIGHMVGDYEASRDRRDKDLQQIIAQVIRSENRPEGVLLIKTEGRASGPDLVKQGTYWWTVLAFLVEYFTDPDYGGA